MKDGVIFDIIDNLNKLSQESLTSMVSWFLTGDLKDLVKIHIMNHPAGCELSFPESLIKIRLYLGHEKLFPGFCMIEDMFEEINI